MNILARYTLKYLWLNKKRTGVTILGVILSTALICGVILLGISFQRMMIDRAIGYMGNYHAILQRVPVDKAGYITNYQAVETAMVTTTFNGMVAGAENLSKPYLYIVAKDDQAMIDLPGDVVSGRLPQAENEIAISQIMASQMAELTGSPIELGSPLRVSLGQRTLNGEVLAPYYNFLEEDEVFMPEGTVTYTVVGILAPTFEESIFDFPGYSAITHLSTGSLPNSGVVDIGLRVRNPYALYTTMEAIISSTGLTRFNENNISDETVIVNYNDSLLQWIGVNDNSSYLMFFVSILGFMIGLVVVGSGLVIFNAFSISVSERKKQFGMFASTGATTGQIQRSVLFEALVIALAGIPLGITGGIVGVGITLAYAENIIRQVFSEAAGMQLIVSPLVIALTVVFTGATILLSAWVPARRASKISPIDAIRLSGDLQSNSPKRLISSPLVRRLLGFEGELALKSVQRDRKRFRATVFSLVISIVLFVTFNAMMDYSTTTARMNNQADNYDLGLYLSGGVEENERFIQEAVHLPQVTAYSHKRCLWGQSDITADRITSEAARAYEELGWQSTVDDQPDFTVTVCAYGQPEFERYAGSLGLDPQEFSRTDSLKAMLVNRNQVRLNKLYEFDLIDINAGDTLVYSGQPVFDENGDLVEAPRSVSLTIGAVASDVPMGSYQPSQGLILVVSEPAFERIAAQVGVETEDLGPGELYIKTSDIVALTAEVKQRYPAIVGKELFYSSTYEYNQREQMIEVVVKLFFYGFLTLITLVGVTNIINTIDTNLHLRRREFAMLKSVGLTPNGFHKILRYESLFYSLTALLLGLPVAVVLSALLFTRYTGVSSFALSLPWVPMLLCALGVVLLVFVTMTASGARIGEDNIIDTIKEENL